MIQDPKLFFIENSDYKEDDIVIIKKIHKGFTNESFFIKTKDNFEWQVRFTGLNNIVFRENEREVLKVINDKDFIYYDLDGNSIKKWSKGKDLSIFFNKKKKMILLCKKINELHSIDISNNKKIIDNDYLIYLEKTVDIDINVKKKYLELLEKYKNLDKVLSHNDLSPWNIIYDGKTIKFIDYEWSRRNDNYFDIANFMRESNLSFKWLKFFSKNIDNIEISILKDFLFIVTCFAYQWTFIANEDRILFKYRKKSYKKMNYLYKKLFYNNYG